MWLEYLLDQSFCLFKFLSIGRHLLSSNMQLQLQIKILSLNLCNMLPSASSNPSTNPLQFTKSHGRINAIRLFLQILEQLATGSNTSSPTPLLPLLQARPFSLNPQNLVADHPVCAARCRNPRQTALGSHGRGCLVHQ